MSDVDTSNATLIELTADIASAYVSNNAVSAADLPEPDQEYSRRVERHGRRT